LEAEKLKAKKKKKKDEAMDSQPLALSKFFE